MFETKGFDFRLFLPVILIIIFSFGVIASISPNNLPNHFVYFLVSIVFFLLFTFLDLEILFSLSPLIYIFSVAFLALPFLFGTVTRGSVRWVPIGNYTIQPSEIIKPFICLFSAWFWSKNSFTVKKYLIYSGMFLPVFLMIFASPDLGSTLVILSIFIIGTFLSGITTKQLLMLIGIFIIFLPLGWFSLRDYQKTRLIHFFNPLTDPLGEGYHQIQSKIAVGSGRITGWGLGRGTQSQLMFLPERHTDFIFSSMAEEFGFLGCLTLLFLYFFIFKRILKISLLAEQKLQFLLIIGVFISLFFQTLINIGMNIGILPITGITLPLFSYGGSSLVATMIGLGMIMNIYRSNRKNTIVSIRHF